MHSVRIDIPEEAYAEAIKRAELAGFKSPESFIQDFVVNDLSEETANYDHLFTPEVITHLDQITEEIAAGGKTYSMEEVDEYLAEKKAEWLKRHAN